MSQIMCTVNNCKWWATGNICKASKILVTSDEVGDQYPENVDVDQLSMLVNESGTTPTETCMETCCKTFYREKK